MSSVTTISDDEPLDYDCDACCTRDVLYGGYECGICRVHYSDGASTTLRDAFIAALDGKRR